MTAAATTGPKSGPRPTSSRPAMRRRHACARRFPARSRRWVHCFYCAPGVDNILQTTCDGQMLAGGSQEIVASQPFARKWRTQWERDGAWVLYPGRLKARDRGHPRGGLERSSETGATGRLIRGRLLCMIDNQNVSERLLPAPASAQAALGLPYTAPEGRSDHQRRLAHLYRSL
jgi:hypothetical protein